ncbi:methionine synthase [Aminipila butyrica]|uniref:Methionine synthase n=1 Tax=Aminipila butyrica TaxID=433296 RepID=A0A858BRL9_9FIRM|nr:methionine synthase [Aminipila butyrica]QIB68543.1 methionine synthase [Aminipila butyrica]
MDITLPAEISRDFIYSCMGFGNHTPDPASLQLIDTCCEMVLSAAVPRQVHRVFPLERQQEGGFYLSNPQNSLAGQAITDHLQGCTHCLLLAVTLGVQVDNLIRRAQVTDMAKAVALDACASSLVEDICDQINDQLQAEYAQQGMDLTFRFSPGYGDFPLESQRLFSQLLEMGKKIGLTHSREHLLLPRKSVTALIGIFPAGSRQSQKQQEIGEGTEAEDKPFESGIGSGDSGARACQICSLKDTCALRAAGGYCGKRT